MMSRAHVLNWNGKDVPDELRELPAGRYVIEPVDALSPLTDEEEEGLRQALESLRGGRGRTLEQVRQTIGAVLRR
jgi:hypothetical protein